MSLAVVETGNGGQLTVPERGDIFVKRKCDFLCTLDQRGFMEYLPLFL